ncbi:hypothetical protein [Actinomyces sp. MRS3W]|uniref:hypothetical protein n=1 Tax=Actinomyces sp. MRS3W TaxID=2800796 RepID=UPI0028FDA01C|nr:hypothetical protein [Actinomyces sp. MRS3W]MDU0349231.1 hypothetical protein [Actinomyces sp. MRS3W]
MAAASSTRRKAPSAAEQARREAQSRQDKGETTPVDVDLWGVTVTVDPDMLTDAEIMEWMIISSDEEETDQARLTAQMKATKMLCGGRYRQVIRAIRAANDGRATIEDTAQILARIMEAISPEA